MDNANLGHTSPICILPNGIKVRVDLNNKEIKRQICEAKTTEEIFSLLDQYRTTLDETEKL